MCVFKSAEEGISREEYEKLANEYEQVEKERSDELKELTYLRWCNACLRYELKRYQLLQEYIQGSKDQLEQDFEEGGDSVGFRIEEQLGSPKRVEPRFGAAKGGEVSSKRQKLLKKFKKLVDGKGKHEKKCFGRLSVCDEMQDQEHVVHARNSCSSV